MESFDAYRKWLGIPREEQPPNHYRLLGIGLFESDVDVISNAADRQMAHVRSFQTGPHSELSQQILNELSAARLCLLDPVRKAAYDAALRQQLSALGPLPGTLSGTVSAPPPAAPPPPSPGLGAAPPVQPPVPPLPSVPVVRLGATASARTYNHRRRQQIVWRALASVVILLLVISLGLIAWALSTGNWPSGGRSPGGPLAAPTTSGSATATAQQTAGQAAAPLDTARMGPSGVGQPHRAGPDAPESGGVLAIPGLEDQPTLKPSESMAEPAGVKHELRGHRGAVSAVAFSPDSQMVLSGGEDGALRLWDVIAGGELRQFAPPGAADRPAAASAAPVPGPAPTGGEAPVLGPRAAEEAPADSQTAAAGAASAPSERPAAATDALPIVAVCFAPPDGQAILASSARLDPLSAGVVRAFAIDGKPTHEIKVAGALAAWDVSFSPDGQHLALACEDSTIALLAFARNGGPTREIHRAAGHQGPVRSVAFSPDGTQLLSGGDDQTVRLWNAKTGEEIRPMLGHQGSVRAVAFSPDGSYGISGGDDKLVWVWELKTGTRLFACKGHTAPVTGAVFSPDGRRILSGSADGTIRIWSARDGRELGLFPAHAGGVRAVDIAPNNRQAVSAGNDGVVRIWNLPDLSMPEQSTPAAVAGPPGTLDAGPPAHVPPNAPDGNGLSGTAEAPPGETSSTALGASGLPAELSAIKDLGCRQGMAKSALLQYYGGDEQTEAALERALQWLVRHQQPDGHWSFAHQTAECGNECANPGTLQDAPKAATALTLLALLGAGHTPQAGKFRKAVNEGLNWLRRHMVYAGAVAAAYEPEAQGLPGHAWATIVLCEACELMRDRANSLSAGKAVQFIVVTQNADGGWGDRPAWQNQPAEQSNLHATGWNLLALAAAQRAGLPVPGQTLAQARQYLEQPTAGSGRGLRRLLGSSDPLDAALVLLAGQRLGWKDEGAQVPALIDKLRASGPATSGAFGANWLHSELLRDCGQKDWRQWNAALRGHLLSSQQTQGHGAGSWFVDTGAWGNREGGRLFCTAMGALTLEVYYRCPPPARATGAK